MVLWLGGRARLVNLPLTLALGRHALTTPDPRLPLLLGHPFLGGAGARMQLLHLLAHRAGGRGRFEVYRPASSAAFADCRAPPPAAPVRGVVLALVRLNLLSANYLDLLSHGAVTHRRGWPRWHQSHARTPDGASRGTWTCRGHAVGGRFEGMGLSACNGLPPPPCRDGAQAHARVARVGGGRAAMA